MNQSVGGITETAISVICQLTEKAIINIPAKPRIADEKRPSHQFVISQVLTSASSTIFACRLECSEACFA